MALQNELAFSVAVVTPNGDLLFFENLLETCSIEDLAGELAQRLTFTAKNERLAKKRLAQYLANGSEIRYYAGYERPLVERFRGRLFANRSSYAGVPRHGGTAYDELYYLANSEDDRYYPAGKTGKQIILDIAQAWGIPTGDIDGPNEALSKKAFRSKALGEQISVALRESRKKGGGRWVVRMSKGKLETVRRAKSKRPFVFEAEDMSQLDIDRSIEALKTRAKIVGRDKNGSKVLGTADGLTQFGILQSIVNRSDYHKPEGAKRAAIQLIEDEGKEIRSRSFDAPDRPELRKGDIVIARARSLDDNYIVRSVVHDPIAQRMFLEVIDPDEGEVEIDFEATGLYSWEPPKEDRSGGHVKGGEQSKSGWQWPVSGPITSDFGARTGGTHYGTDIGASIGTAVAPGKPGRVKIAGVQSGYGNVIYIDHGFGVESRYGHLSAFSVKAGDEVGYTDKIGEVGQTGDATGPHLHFEIRVNGSPMDPENFLP